MTARTNVRLRLLAGARREADGVRDDSRLRRCAAGRPGRGRVVDQTGTPKRGDRAVGVARRYGGTAGRSEYCQVGVFLAYAAPDGGTFLDRVR